MTKRKISAMPADKDQSVNKNDPSGKSKLPPNADFEVAEWLEAETLEHEKRAQQMGFGSMFDKGLSQSKTRKKKKP